jgi:hypothetical protein
MDLAGVWFSSAAPFVPLRNEVLSECCCSEEMARFISARDSLPEGLRGFIVPYTVEEYQAKNATLFLTADGLGGFALMQGELASLFSLPGAHYGDMLVREAVQRGASKLSCYDTRGKLPSLYGRHGFTETFRASWDDEFAPKNWNFAAWGRPDYVEMSR